MRTDRLSLHSGPRAAIENCTVPGADHTGAVQALTAALVPALGEEARTSAEHLLALAGHYALEPFTPLEHARAKLDVTRAEFTHLLSWFDRIPELGTAVEHGPAGRYWTNTVLPLQRSGAFDDALAGRARFPLMVGVYPGPSCMFRCHFCVRVTGARYHHDTLADGNAVLASVIDEIPADGEHGLALSGGLEPLTNPDLGGLVERAAARGVRTTLYTNAFALTEQRLARQPSLWRLDAIRASLYGLNAREYRETTTNAAGFDRVRTNLARLQRLRQRREEPVTLGLNYLVVPGRVRRLPQLVDYIAELNEVAPERPVDFLSLREDYSGRPDGALTPDERMELREALHEFARRAARLTPTLRIDYGYALSSVLMGVPARLPRVGWENMRPTAHPQVSVQVDLRGDVYLYREAGFPGLAGADRYIAGRVGPGTSLTDVVDEFVRGGHRIRPAPGDEYFLDGFDQVITLRLAQLEADRKAGWQREQGLLR